MLQDLADVPVVVSPVCFASVPTQWGWFVAVRRGEVAGLQSLLPLGFLTINPSFLVPRNDGPLTHSHAAVRNSLIKAR
jgi:hypothetical protein